MRYMEQQSPTAGGGLAAWASNYPGLAQSYQAQQQALRNPAADQQNRTETVTTEVTTTPMGSDIAPAIGTYAQMKADVAVGGGQGPVDLGTAVQPMVQPNLQRVRDFIQSQAPRSAMYAGY
jgi:hypothetical protein